MTTPKRPRDPSQLAKFIVDVATGEKDEITAHEGKTASKAIGAKARARVLTPEQRSSIAHTAAAARWKKGD